ncbi:hypothetical protein ACFWIA_30380 [Streptomyces sp. NPDC127068]|uniref:nSTAND1 domain-containing NTPase n=1 Tax=Streptomyces sp. NPDC127068 TaxID=3347127 RepID=UPI00365A3E74
MGRQEKPLDPGAGPLQSFAHELRALRRAAGSPTYRVMAAGSPYSASTLSAAAAGERRPSLPVTLAYVLACGGDPKEWEGRWREAVAREPALPDVLGGHPPYPGLARYDTADRAHFFGRDALVAEVLQRVRSSRFTALVGASGSGKSSLLRAGLVPAFQESPGDGSGACVIRILTPGRLPARTHRELFTAGALVLVDQFEEVFTLCRDPVERSAFIALLTGTDARVVIAVRADFYGRCAEHPALAAALQDSALLVGPMTAEQLREAVVGPAAAERLIVERSLTARIVAEVAGEPGGLPLMSHALWETWRRRRGRTLTESAYEAVGGIQGAIAHTAEELFRAFSTDEAGAARSLLLRLVSPGEATEDTRRPASHAELVRSPVDARVLERLVRARLLTADDGTVNLAHEALITGWPRLRRWIETDREVLRLHRGLTEAARVWASLDRDEGALYRGAQLEAARETFHVKHRAVDTGLTLLERDFLTASLHAQGDALRSAARTARRLRALTVTLSVLLCLAVIAGLTAWHQSRVSDRRAFEAEARRIADTAEAIRSVDPRLAMRLSLAAWRVADLPETREALFAAAAQPEEAAYSPIISGFTSEDPGVWERYSADGEALVSIGPKRTERWDVAAEDYDEQPGLGEHLRGVVDVSSDLRTVAVATADGVRLWDLAAGRFTTPAFGPGTGKTDGELAASGRFLATHSRHGPLRLWSTTTGREVFRTTDRSAEIQRLQISPDDRLLAYCPEEGPLQLWDIRERRRLPARWTTPGDCQQDEPVFTPDGRALAFPSETGVRVRDARSGRERLRIATVGTPSVAFSADGAHLATLVRGVVELRRTAAPAAPVLRVPATGTRAFDLRLDTAAGLIRYREGAAPRLTVRTLRFDTRRLRAAEYPLISGAEFSSDGNALVTTRPGRFQLRDAAGKLRHDLPAPASCQDRCDRVLGFQGDGQRFAHLDTGGRVVVRDTRSGTATATLPPRSDVNGVVLQWTGSQVAVSRSPSSGDVIESAPLLPQLGPPVWSAVHRGDDTGILLMSAAGHPLITEHRRRLDPDIEDVAHLMEGEGQPQAMAFTPHDRGTAMAMVDTTGRITLWDVQGWFRLAVLAPGDEDPVPSTGPARQTLAFSPDGRTLAAGGADGSLRLWDLSSPRGKGLRLPRADGPVLALAFTSDGTRLRVSTPHVASRTHELSPERAAETICARVSDPLSTSEWKTHLPDVPHRRTCPA